MTATYTVYSSTRFDPARPNVDWTCDWIDFSTDKPEVYWARSGSEYDIRTTGTDYETATRIAREWHEKYGSFRTVKIVKLTGDDSGPLGDRKSVIVSRS